MIPQREAMMQLARLVGLEHFVERFGSPQTADPDAAALATLVEERIEWVASGLVEEAAASDDVVDGASARAFLDDRLQTFSELIGDEQRKTIRAAFAERTRDW